MQAVITVVGKDKIGIIARVSSVLEEHKVNIVDISQTIIQDYFTMIMIVDLTKMNVEFQNFIENLNKTGESLGVSIRVQHEDIFKAMHNI